LNNVDQAKSTALAISKEISDPLEILCESFKGIKHNAVVFVSTLAKILTPTHPHLRRGQNSGDSAPWLRTTSLAGCLLE
jgi:hypothetical protein